MTLVFSATGSNYCAIWCDNLFLYFTYALE